MLMSNCGQTHWRMCPGVRSNEVLQTACLFVKKKRLLPSVWLQLTTLRSLLVTSGYFWRQPWHTQWFPCMKCHYNPAMEGQTDTQWMNETPRFFRFNRHLTSVLCSSGKCWNYFLRMRAKTENFLSWSLQRWTFNFCVSITFLPVNLYNRSHNLYSPCSLTLSAWRSDRLCVTWYEHKEQIFREGVTNKRRQW
jgi:hypothetical protein